MRNEGARHLQIALTRCACSVLPLVVLAGYGYRASTPVKVTQGLEHSWRIFVGLGGLVPLLIFYSRYRLVTSSSFQKHNIKRRGGFSPRLYWLIAKRYWKSLLGASLCWFMYVNMACLGGRSC